jgi:hypothetical protein
MPRTIRFHLDECCDPSIADGLRRRNIEVTTSQEAGLLEAEDEQQAAYGLAQDREPDSSKLCSREGCSLLSKLG